ncbi:MAG TPA: GTP cyclohydrolase I FolE [Burkholderiaceae bacterium]|nr:GTP cyclohydrolase I FolE [Burkholderiaceae bacterium]
MPAHPPHDHDHDHDHARAPAAPDACGIPRRGGFDPAAFERAIGDLLAACGLAPDAEHMGRTPQRVRELWQRRLLGGYELDPAGALGDGFADPRTDLVVIRGIAVHGVCPHHLVPFRGVAHVGYLPGGRLHGFGRIARMVDAIGHRFTYQEWMTRDVADALVSHGRARGAACVIEAEQLCLLLGEDRRGDERVVTQAFAGEFERSDRDRAEFLRAIGGAR